MTTLERLLAAAALAVFVFALAIALSGCPPGTRCGHTDPRAFLFFCEYGAWPSEAPPDAGP